MTTINISIKNLTLMSSHAAAAPTIKALMPEGILGSTLHEPAAEVVVQHVKSNSGPRFTRIAADGQRLAAADTTGHVAVIDHSTGLMWSVESLGDPDDEDDGISQEKCIERCKELRLLGHDDWTLPTRSQLAGLVDDTRHEPAIDVALFPRVKPRWHWTSTAAAWSSSAAWLVDFYLGYVYNYYRLYSGFALAVRRAGQ